MDNKLFRLRLFAGKVAGRSKTCGKKIKYKSEQTASNAAEFLNSKGKCRGYLEPYPCYFCNSWHIGGKKPLGVLEALAEPVETIKTKFKQSVNESEKIKHVAKHNEPKGEIIYRQQN